MTHLKSYTSLEQSKVLAEILPLESADMYYPCEGVSPKFGVALSISNNIPCWSLAVLLGVLPKTFNYNNHTYQFMYNTHGMFYINVDNYNEDTFCSTNKNLVDACCELILKLNELNLL